MRTYFKRLLTVLMVLAMLVSMVALPAMATDGSDTTTADSVSETEVSVSTLEELVKALASDSTLPIVVNGMIDVAADTTLNLNGKTVSSTHANDYAMIHVLNGATLTINGEGTITCAAGGNNTGATIWVEGALIQNGGTIGLTGSWSLGFAVDLRPNAWGTAHTAPATFEMNGGQIYASDTAVRVASSSSDSYEEMGVSFTMNNGTINSSWDAIFVQHLCVGDLDVKVTNGTVSGSNSVLRVYGDAGSDVDINITDGTFTGVVKIADAYISANPITISGGTFSTEPTDYLADGYCVGIDNTTYTVGEHKLTAVAAKSATCGEDGVNAHYTCENCDKLYNDAAGLSQLTQQQATIPATGHTLTKVPAKAVTCTVDGNIEHYACSVCKGLFVDAEGKTGVSTPVVKAVGHQLTKTAAKAATCTTAGNIEYYTCSVCKGLFTDAEGKTATTAEKVVVAATGHTLKKVEAVAPTYTAGGNIEHYACACGVLFADAEGKTATTAEAVALAQLIEIKESTAEVSSDAVDTAIKEAETTGSVTIDLVEVAESETTTPDSSSDSETKPAPVVSSAALPVESLEKVAEISEDATLTVNMTEVTVTMDAKTMAAVAEQSAGETVTLKVEKVETKTLTEKQQAAVENKEVAVVITATMISNDTAISDFKGGSVTIAIPFTPAEGTEGSDYQVYYVADDGTMTAHDTEYKNGCLVFSTTHFSDYVVVNTADPTVPKTGDSANLLLHTSVMVIALAGLTALFIGKKKFSF